MKFLQIGFGGIGQKRVEAINTLYPDATVFVFDPFNDAKQVNVKRLTDVADINFDLVCISIVHSDVLNIVREIKHFQIKKLLIEKPLGINRNQSNEIVNLIKSMACDFCGGFNYRYYPHLLKLHSDFRDPKVEQGRLLHARAVLEHGGRPNMEKEWKMQKISAGGGSLIDPGIHIIDLMQHFFGTVKPITQVNSDRFWNTDVESFVSLSAHTGCNAPLTLIASTSTWCNNFEFKAIFENFEYFLTGRGGNYGDMTLTRINRWHWQSKNETLNINFGSEDTSFLNELKGFMSSDNIYCNLKESFDAMTCVMDFYDLNSTTKNHHAD